MHSKNEGGEGGGDERRREGEEEGRGKKRKALRMGGVLGYGLRQCIYLGGDEVREE
jgi:hypothetical protein